MTRVERTRATPALRPDVPPFAENLVAPTPVTLTAPLLPAGALTVDAEKDLVFAWTGASAGKIAFNLRTVTSSSVTTTAGSFVSCQFDASALTGTIPTALLTMLDKTDATTKPERGLRRVSVVT